MNMPYINLFNVHEADRELITEMIDHHGYLLTCPKYDSSITVKLIHNEILKQLYRDQRWTVPIWSAWRMPHTTYEPSEDEMKFIQKKVADLIQCGVFERQLF